MDINKYTYQVSWSEEDHEYVATVAEFPSLSWLDADRHQAERGLLDLVTEVVEDMEAAGEAVPVPLGSRNYSGKFNVRTSPSLHRRWKGKLRADHTRTGMLTTRRHSQH